VLTEEWAPYNYSENGVLKGFSVEIVQYIIQDLKLDAVVRVYPSMRATHQLRNRSNAMFISLFRTAEREEEFHWIGPLIDSSIYFYKRKDSSLEITSIEDAKKVGVIASRHAGLVHQRLKAAGFDNLDDTAVHGLEVYKKLLAGRSDLGISDAPLGVKHILKEIGQPVDALTQTPVKILTSALYIAANKKISVQEIARWQKAFDQLKENGIYDQILKKYSQ